MAPTATAASSLTASALAVLASCNLKELHLKRADGSRILDSLHATCRAGGLVPPGTPDGTPRERYLAVFDAALNSGLGCWILDYVEVVCADRHLTSNDPLEVYLLDGGFVKAWAQACLQRAEQNATAALTSDASFHAFQSSQLQQQLAQMRVLVSVLRSLDRIRAVAAGGAAAMVTATAAAAAAATAGGGTGTVQDRLSVRAELRQAVLLEQAFQVMDWFSRQGLVGPRAAPGGRFASYAEWSRAVTARRSRAAPRQLFLDSLLQSLSLSGAYPSASIPNMLHTLLLVVRDVDPATWASKLALMSYYLMDAGVLDGTDVVASSATAASSAGPVGCCGPRLDAALGDLRRTFRLAAGEVGVWQCYYLLDCASPETPGTEDPYLARACALLPSYVTEATPFAFIEALLALGRPDVALAVDRGQFGAAGGGPVGGAAPGGRGGATAPASSSGRSYSSMAQAMTLLEVRLRCGLLTEAFMLLRQHTADLAGRGGSREQLREHTRGLIRRLAEWAAEADAAADSAAAPEATSAATAAAGGGGGARWLGRLAELPLDATEEFVLVEWLAEQAEAGRIAGTFLPLFFLQRGRVSEAMSAWRKWTAQQDALESAGGRGRTGSAALVPGLVSAALDAEYEATVPAPLRSVEVVAPSTTAGPAAVASTLTLWGSAPGQGAVSILAGLVNQTSPDQPVALLPFHGTEPPPLITRVIQLPPTLLSAAMAPLPPMTAAADAANPPIDVAASGNAGDVFPQQQHASFSAMPLLLPSTAPFRTPPASPGVDDAAPFRPSQPSVAAGPLGGAGGGGGLLFSVGAGAVAAGGAERPPTGAPVGGIIPKGLRSSKRSKPNDWP